MKGNDYNHLLRKDICKYVIFLVVVYYLAEAVGRRSSVRKVFFKISQNSHEDIIIGVSFLIMLRASDLKLNQKKPRTQVFSCEFCENFKNTFFIEDLRPTYFD